MDPSLPKTYVLCLSAESGRAGSPKKLLLHVRAGAESHPGLAVRIAAGSPATLAGHATWSE